MEYSRTTYANHTRCFSVTFSNHIHSCSNLLSYSLSIARSQSNALVHWNLATSGTNLAFVFVQLQSLDRHGVKYNNYNRIKIQKTCLQRQYPPQPYSLSDLRHEVNVRRIGEMFVCFAWRCGVRPGTPAAGLGGARERKVRLPLLWFILQVYFWFFDI